jgi:hypothetical protein
MNSHEIEHNVKTIFENFSKENFLFDLMLAYGISKTSITRLKSGDFNLSKVEGEVLYKKKIFFKEEETDKLLSSIETISKEERIIKHVPRFAILTDYKTLVARDLKLGKNLDIAIKDLPKHYNFFLPLAGAEVYNASNDNEADRNAAYKMSTLYDELVSKNKDVYNSKESVHQLNIFLSRLLFCLFAEDTGVFDGKSIFTNTMVQHTLEDGSDMHLFLNRVFEKLNTNGNNGFADYLTKFPYVNGGLFGADINSPVFTAKARKILIELGDLNWKEINPDIFGSMIQAVVLPEYRSDLGMHYTSVPNILKLIKPLFLDELYEEFEASANSAPKLQKLIQRISNIKFFDPACGSGNFLIIVYKEIRRLEIDILKRIVELKGDTLFVESSISLTQFYGIEIDDFAHEVAILSLYLAEHQMNQYFDQQLEGYTEPKSIIPLKPSGNIVQGNAARVDWKTVCPIAPTDEVYIIGNPPYLGYARQVAEQKKDMDLTFVGIKDYKKLDYIGCWFYKASLFIQNKYNAKYAFVTTNSITQGEQVALLWPLILNLNQEISFAHQSFKWTNNAKSNAGVSVVIIGIRNCNEKEKFLYHQNIKHSVRNINPYLTNSPNIYILPRFTSISKLPLMIKGSSPSDDGNLLLKSNEKDKLVLKNPSVVKYLKKYIGAKDFIESTYRYCIHITEDDVEEACKIPELNERFEKVRRFRLKSSKEATRKKADTPYLFDEDKYQNKEFILVPQTSSELRTYIPIGFFDGTYVPSNGARIIYNSESWLFGILSSKMHMVWIHATAGRLETRIQYSNTLCYNTFPFPDISVKQKENLNLYVFAILDERAKHPEKSMAQLYDPDKMPKGLKQAHEELDRAVEQCYRLQPFTSDTERLEYLFKLYEEMTKSGTLFEKQGKKRMVKGK